MKIDGTEGAFQIPDSEKAKNRLDNPARNFKEIFEQTLKTATPPTAAPAAPTCVQQSLPLMKTDRPIGDQADVVECVAHLLDVLDEYRRHLCQPGSSLKTIEALVQKLDGQRQSLAPIVNDLPDGDALKTILNQSLVAASVEIFKFHRGDYLAA